MADRRIFVATRKGYNYDGRSRVGAEHGSFVTDEIADRFSLVEVPSGSAEQVIKALGNTTIKGRKTSVRRERF